MIKDLFEASKDRIKNPFISSFAIGIIVLNWKSILILIFSDLSIEERILCVEEYYIDWQGFFLHPLFIAIFYTLLLPYLMVGINNFLKTANKKKIEGYYEQEVTRVKEKSILAEEEVKLELIKANSNDLTRANETIESLKKSNEEKEDMLSQLRTEFNKLKNDNERLKNEEVTGKNNGINVIGNDAFHEEKIESLDSLKGHVHILANEDLFSVFMELSQGIEENISEIREDYYSKHQMEIETLARMGMFQLSRNINNLMKITLTNKGRNSKKKIMNLLEGVKVHP